MKKMFNGRACCLLQLCCAPAQQVEALSEWMVESWGCTPDQGKLYATSLLEQSDLAPKGLVHGLLKAGFDLGEKHAKAKA